MLSKGVIWLFEHYLPLVNYLAFYLIFCLPRVTNVPQFLLFFFYPIEILKWKLWTVTYSNQFPFPSLEDELFSRYTDINPSLSFSVSSSDRPPGVWRRGWSSLPAWLLSTSEMMLSFFHNLSSSLCPVLSAIFPMGNEDTVFPGGHKQLGEMLYLVLTRSKSSL